VVFFFVFDVSALASVVAVADVEFAVSFDPPPEPVSVLV
jgi:hypothetical protein